MSFDLRTGNDVPAPWRGRRRAATTAAGVSRRGKVNHGKHLIVYRNYHLIDFESSGRYFGQWAVLKFLVFTEPISLDPTCRPRSRSLGMSSRPKAPACLTSEAL